MGQQADQMISVFQSNVRDCDELRGRVLVDRCRSRRAALLGRVPGRAPVPVRVRRETGELWEISQLFEQRLTKQNIKKNQRVWETRLGY